MTKLTNNLFGKRFWAVLVAILMIGVRLITSGKD